MAKLVRGKRASEVQKEFLIKYLEEFVDIANDKFVTTEDVKFRESKWKELAVSLNALGGTHKDSTKWRKYWRDLRLHTRSKYFAIKQAKQKNKRIKGLSPLQERIIKITTSEDFDDEDDERMSKMTITEEVDEQITKMSEEFEDDSDEQITTIVKEEIDIDDTPESDLNSYLITSRESQDNAKHSYGDFVINCGIGGNTTVSASENAETIITTIMNSNTATPSTIMDSNNTGIAKSNLRRQKKKVFQPEKRQVEQIFEIEKKKLCEMEISNYLKREQIAVLREQVHVIKQQTEAIRADTEVKVSVASRLQDLIHIFGEKGSKL